MEVNKLDPPDLFAVFLVLMTFMYLYTLQKAVT